MKRFAVVLLGALGGVSCTAAAVDAAAPAPPRAHLRDFVCQHGGDPAQRSVSVMAIMRPISGTQRMAIRFELLSKSRRRGPYGSVHGGDLGMWLTPVGEPNLGQRPGDVWSISHPVTGLPAPATYRYRVTFRWTGSGDHVLATRMLPSAKCFQPAPDLLVASIMVNPIAGKPTLDRYTALIRNAAPVAAGAFEIEFAPPPGAGSAPKQRFVDGLAAHGSRYETFIGPACTTASAPTVIVDPNHQVEDSNPANNSLRASCPATTPAF